MKLDSTKWKWVPVEPTSHMLQSACDEEQSPLPMWSRMRAIYTAIARAALAGGQSYENPEQLDERAAFDHWFRCYQYLPDDADTTQYDEAFLAFKAWQARAALAAPVSDNAGCESETDENDPQVQMDGLEKACRRYTEMMDKYYPSVKAERDEELHSGIPSKQHIRWMLKQIPKLSPTRAHRWLGFVQCALVHWGITSIDAEREATRGMFYE